jgi:hypothetical protein
MSMKKSLFASYIFILTSALMIAGCASKTEEPVGFTVEADKEITSSKTDNSAEAPKEAPGAGIPSSGKRGVFKTFPIYTDEASPDNHYYPSGWMGDYSDINFDAAYLDNPHGGTSSIRVKYSNRASQGARWAGVYWQNPPNNWGSRPGGYDLTGASRLVFWARGEKGGEHIDEFKVGGITGEYSDTDVAGIGPVKLTAAWKQYVIDLEGKDLSSIIGGFAWAANLDNNPEGFTMYLDDLRFE